MSSPGDRAEQPGPGGHAAGRRAAGSDPQSAGAVPSDVTGLAEAVHELEEAEHDRPPHAGPVSNVITALAAAALGVAAVVGSLNLGVGSPGEPGPGTWPLLISVALLVLSVALAVLARHHTDAERFTRASWQVLAGLATMIFFVAVIPYVGFEIPAAVLTFLWLRFLGGEGWRLSIVTSVAVVVAFYLIFVAALSVRIPHLF
jgi:putative tricarboxylic transport membrane protein